MFMLLLFAVGSVALGAIVGLAPRLGARALGAAQTFALAAALTVVVVHLLPESAEAIGAWSFAGFLGGLVAPLLVERLAGRVWPRAHHGAIAATAGYVGLLLHQVGDGVGLWVLGSEGWGGADAAFALSAHTVPVTMLFVLRFAALRGRRSAVAHAGGLAVASVAGLCLGALVPPGALERYDPWVEAIVSGLLLHVIAHDLRVDEVRTTAVRSLDLLAIAAGVLLTLAGSHAHQHALGHESRVQDGFFHALFDLSLESAPMLLVGLVLGAVVQVLGGSVPHRWLRNGSDARQAVRGAIMGAPVPLCSCAVLPIARSLHLRGGGAALVVAFLLATPELGVETFVLTWQFFGLEFAAMRLAGAILLAVLAALVVARVVGREPRPQPAVPSAPIELVSTPGKGFPARLLDAFDELLLHIAPWIVVGLVAAAYVETLVPPDQLASLAQSGLDIPVVTLVSMVSYVCASASTPLAAILLSKGISPGAVFAGLVVGPVTNLATIYFVRRTYGPRAAAVGFGAFIAMATAVALAINAWAVVTPNLPAEGAAHHHGFLGTCATVALAAFAIRNLWLSGLRAWIASLASFGDQTPPPHSGGHVCSGGHDHTVHAVAQDAET